MSDAHSLPDPIVAPPVRPGVYVRGSETVDLILKAALHVLIEEGAAAFTLRRIATQCGLKVGNVSRHFPRKEMLVQVLLDELLAPSDSRMDHLMQEPGITPEEALTIVITGTLDEIGSKRTTHLFIELWAMANHNEFIADRVEGAYRLVHRIIGSLISKINPVLLPQEVEILALYVNATLEGTTMLAGFGKPWEAQMPHLKAIAVKSLLTCIRTMTSQDIKLIEKSGL